MSIMDIIIIYHNYIIIILIIFIIIIIIILFTDNTEPAQKYQSKVSLVTDLKHLQR